ncbi:DUF1176 domain-containing protein [Chelativorans alearense]|uniref:DUF1176 domain-containing protein n=1 Tax=Chelativorans alearense TaxID=2681495 RepID=UPI001FECBF5D|nr:DUF1176 domain-containing protein [Chelativorans alearense]
MKPLLLVAAMASFWLVPGPPPTAAEPAYLDDRSSPEALVRSLYNAINRKEYARAYAYFSTPPAETLEDYAAGYADTESVEVVAGLASREGAAGSVYYALPVAILAQDASGEDQVFAGCYTLRLADPLVQTTPFTPLHIEEAHLSPADGPPRDALPPACGDAPPQEEGNILFEEAKKIFATLYGDECRTGADAPEEPQHHVIPYNYAYEEEDTPPHEAHMFRFFCNVGAYNETHAYLMTDGRGQLLPLRFATPELDIRYENDDMEGAVEEMRIIGYTSDDLLVNSEFDPDTLEITSSAKWRGLGDASASGIWLFRSGVFTLVKYEADASYDGEVNPELLVDYYSTP